MSGDPIDDVNRTIAVFGTDIDGYRTDVIFVVNFNSETNKVKVVAIPRDTKVDWTTEQKERLKELRGYTRSVSKINEMTAYAGIGNIRDFTIKQIESLLGVKVDNYVIVTLDSFRKIVDAIDGVVVDVPMDMYYVDPYQDLYIDLKAGVQTLDGDKAEQLVRFRKGYVDGDEGRIRTQQLFLEAFAEKVLSPQIITKIPQIISVLFTSVTTDVQLNEVLPYYSYVKNFDLSNLSFYTIPGEASYQNSAWYYIADMTEMQNFCNDIFYEHLMPSEEDLTSGKIEVDKAVTIEVLNGSGVSGAAARARDLLQGDAYVVSTIGNYTESSLETTEIRAKDLTKAEQFRVYYPHATFTEDATLTYDIQIILGVK